MTFHGTNKQYHTKHPKRIKYKEIKTGIGKHTTIKKVKIKEEKEK